MITNVRHLIQIRRMGMVTRFHTIPTVRPQTTSHHSGNVALLMVLLWHGVTGNALKAALLHDLGESYTGDVPAPTKWAFPGLRHTLEEMEAAAVAYWGLAYPELDREERWWLSFCDTLDLCLYCLEEMALGNVGIRQQFDNGIQALMLKANGLDGNSMLATDVITLLHRLDAAPRGPGFAGMFAVDFHTKEGSAKLLGNK